MPKEILRIPSIFVKNFYFFVMRKLQEIMLWNRNLIGIMVLFTFMVSCETDTDESHWFEDDVTTIAQYLERNLEDYSKFHSILDKGKLLGTIGAYNPYAEGYTLFLPTNEAIDRFIQQNQDYNSFEELLLDTNFVYTFARYHTLNEKVHSFDFPFGAIQDRTLSGDRLAIIYIAVGDSLLIKVNYEASIIKADLEMTNGYIHVISEALAMEGSSGYEWLQEEEGFSILAGAMELVEINKNLWFNKYTILVEHDSVYHKNGIFTVEDLAERVGNPRTPYTNTTNSLYQFAAYHFILGDYFLNDFYWGAREYPTMSIEPVKIDGSSEIKINPGLYIYDTIISEIGDTIEINYIRPIWDQSNIFTNTGPVHVLSDVLVIEDLLERFNGI